MLQMIREFWAFILFGIVIGLIVPIAKSAPETKTTVVYVQRCPDVAP